MPCTTDYIDFLCNELAPLGEVKARKMMGDAEKGHPYPGAKEAYILDIADRTLVREALTTLWLDLPYPKSNKR